MNQALFERTAQRLHLIPKPENCIHSDNSRLFEFRRIVGCLLVLSASLIFGQTAPAADIAFVSANNGNAGTILKSTNGGTSWTSVYTGGASTRINDIYAVDADTIYAVGEVVLKSTDGGSSWTTLLSGQTLNGVSAANADKVFAVGQGTSNQGRVMVSDNGGTSWTTSLLTPPSATGGTVFNRIDAVSATTAYFVGQYLQNTTDNAVIYKTTNGGSTWTAQNTTSGVGYAIDAVNANVAYAGGTLGLNGWVRETTNGSTWAANNFSGTQVRAIAAWDENLIYAAGTSSSVKKSTDGGTTWSSVVAGTSAQFNDIAFLDQDRLLLVSQFGSVRRILDGGASWQDVTPAGYSSYIFTAVTVVPEPSTCILATLACAVMAWSAIRTKR
ncbi:hypothetical protein GC170_22065 [bacterium]|nr:hypothetical protein [bacterium]